ncbi:glucoamylase [Lichtheimia corymbifera JMRC:FSU:9682]|uniref:glucan 1,4-alpha-glucosidase n=1 Tax=Lichtheimia corymbifera JMRC:FSU:9682 TaxID=1263082 RepID=A0A068RK60_9FUNG|nr:glucoamylase [Lichtheimia corymbifera JMRC:FSU:9682]
MKSLFSTAAVLLVSLVNVSQGVPTLFARQSSDDLGSWIDGETTYSEKALLANINPEGAVKGFVAASPSTSNPDYFYCWTRDAALVMRAVVHNYNNEPSDDLATIMQDYVGFQINSMNEDTVCDCLGEPKFNKDGTSYTGAWGRPQNDGPAERASTFIQIAQALKDNSSFVDDTIKPAIQRDLDYVSSLWSETCFDLWLMVMRRALNDGAKFLGNDSYATTASDIESKLKSFYSSDDGYIKVTQQLAGGADYKDSGLDTSTLIAANVASLGDGFFTPSSDEILATSLAIKKSFASLYGINKDSNSSDISPAIGRYPEDKYDGVGNSEGNPWYLCTLAFAELYYRAIGEWKDAGSIKVTDTSAEFFKQFDDATASGTTYKSGTDEFDKIIEAVTAEADSYFARVQKQTPDGSLSEQYNRDSGEPTGAKDLTWSYAAFITASAAHSGKPVA